MVISRDSSCVRATSHSRLSKGTVVNVTDSGAITDATPLDLFDTSACAAMSTSPPTPPRAPHKLRLRHQPYSMLAMEARSF